MEIKAATPPIFVKDIEPDQFFDLVQPNGALWVDAVFAICEKIGLECTDVIPFADGVNLVACVDERWVVKIFPPFHFHQWESDHRTLRHLQGKLSLAISEYRAAGEWQNSWTYLVMSKLEGLSLESVWSGLTHASKIEILNQVGSVMAEVHSLPLDGLKDLRPVWKDFVSEQISACLERHKRKKMPVWFLDGLEPWMANHIGLIEESFRPVLLTGEYTPFNLLVKKNGESFVLSGMIDFGDAMVGFADYDLLGPSLFLGSGHPELIRSLFNGYGIFKDPINFRTRLLLLQIIHRYSDFKSQMRIPDWEEKAKSFDELAKLIWPSQSLDLS